MSNSNIAVLLRQDANCYGIILYHEKCDQIQRITFFGTKCYTHDSLARFKQVI